MDQESIQDNIDRYLSGEMNLDERREFELEVSQTPEIQRLLDFNRKLYKEIEVWGNQKLRKRLDDYYSAYLEESDFDNDQVGQADVDDPKVTTLNKTYRLSGPPWWRLGIAAGITGLLVVCMIFFIRQHQKVELTEETPTETQVDSLEEINPGDSLDDPSKDKQEKNGGQPEPQQSVPGTTKEKMIRSQPVYAFSNIKRLPKSSVRAVNYPQQLQYTFKNGMLILYGDPLIPPLRLKLFRQKGRLLLQFADDFFFIDPTETVRPLNPLGLLSVSDSQPLDESIRIRLANLQESKFTQSDLEVWIGTSPQQIYSFEEKNGKNALILGGLPEGENPLVYVVNGQTFFLVLGASVFELDNAVNQPTILRQINGASSANARIFEDSKEFERKVYKIQ
ncbi:MAG TPA: hypothetical protein PKB07_11095 [Flavilitoribacter sp.]|nr:hypothetical protein [Flavilitoribacter sp.]